MKRQVELTIETATRWYNGYDKELKALALQTFPELEKKELPKSWEELDRIGGGFQSRAGGVMSINGVKTMDINKNVYATKEQAEASLALAQLSQLREVYRDGWKPDWKDLKTKHSIRFWQGNVTEVSSGHVDVFLSFQSAEVRDLFLENFRDLIEQAKPLMS